MERGNGSQHFDAHTTGPGSGNQFPTPGRSSPPNSRTTSRRPSRPCLAVVPSHRRTPRKKVADGTVRSVRGSSGAPCTPTTPRFPSDSERFPIPGRIKRPGIRHRGESLGNAGISRAPPALRPRTSCSAGRCRGVVRSSGWWRAVVPRSGAGKITPSIYNNTKLY